MQTQFKHDCDGCQFLGQGKFGDTLCDWYVCGSAGSRTLLARYGDEPGAYRSMAINETVEPALIEMQALAYGFRFTPEELEVYEERRLKAERGMDRDAFQFRKARVWDAPETFNL